MGVKSVKERTERRRSSYRNGTTTHTLVFLVECTDIRDGTGTALVADDGTNRVPGPGDYFRGVPFNAKDADPVQNSFRHFEVLVEFAADGKPEQDDVHPLDRPPEVSFGSDNFTESYFLDQSNPPKPVVNSASEAPDQSLEREQGELTIQFVINVPFWSAPEMETYGNTVNAESLYIDGDFYAAETLKLAPPTASRQVETIRIGGEPQEVVYYRATFLLKYKSAGWNDSILDVGYNELIEKSEVVNGVTTLVKKLAPIYDHSAGKVVKPWPLDGHGRKKPNPSDPPAELEFVPYAARSWAALYF